MAERKAISPVLAVVILIAITLIAAVAIAGFVFGLFGSFTSSAEVTLSGSSMNFAVASSNHTAEFDCAAVLPTGNGHQWQSWVKLINIGSGNTDVVQWDMTYGGTTYVDNPNSPPCVVTAGSSLYVGFDHGSPHGFLGTATPGEEFTGTVYLSNGASIPLVGVFT